MGLFPDYMHTNSLKQIKKLQKLIKKYGKDNPEMKGILSALEEPLFGGKQVNQFDAIIQGHVHWKLYEESKFTRFHSIRAVGMAYKDDDIDTASYAVLREKTQGGYDFEEVLVKYDRDKMIDNILNSNFPDHAIKKFACIIKTKL